MNYYYNTIFLWFIINNLTISPPIVNTLDIQIILTQLNQKLRNCGVVKIKKPWKVSDKILYVLFFKFFIHDTSNIPESGIDVLFPTPLKITNVKCPCKPRFRTILLQPKKASVPSLINIQTTPRNYIPAGICSNMSIMNTLIEFIGEFYINIYKLICNIPKVWFDFV